MKILVMENELLKISILIDKGADIIEFLYKPYDIDFLWRTDNWLKNPSRFIPTIPKTRGAFLDYYEGGWQEILPNAGSPCQIQGAEMGLHGEIALLPWNYQILEDTINRVSLKLWIRTNRTPFYLEKILTLEKEKPFLKIQEKLVNEGGVEIKFMWGHHPAFGQPFLNNSCILETDAKKIFTQNLPTMEINRVEGDQVFQWPFAKDKHSNPLDLRKIPGPSSGTADMFYLTDFENGWYALTNTNLKLGFGLTWSKEIFKYLWFWQECNGTVSHPWWGRTYAISIEPMSSYFAYDTAKENGSLLTLGSNKSLSVEMIAVAYEGLTTVQKITSEGAIQ